MTEPRSTDTAAPETRSFGAEVPQLLKLMINALYSNREIVLRELISNASDALDKLRFEALTDDAVAPLATDPAIHVRIDAERGLLRVEDNGIGMTREDVIDNLGTIARSGTARFLEQLSGDRKADARLIGQFGVGFYSAFIVADRVTVDTRRAGAPAEQAVRWRSDGQGEYTLEAIERDRPGTTVELQFGADHRDLLEAERIRGILKHYSNHVAFPIHVDDGAREGADADDGPVNEAQALWTRPRQEIDDEAYREFYEGLTGDTVAPSTWAHHHVEGTQRYSLLLYVPGQAPYDLAWNRDDRRGVRLYIQRVFIMDAAEQVVPRYLRFLRGVVDSADLPLNVSRELLQDSPLLARIRATVVKRGLAMIERLAEAGGEAWSNFQRDFGAILKEGLIEDPDHRERIARLVRFSSTRDEQAHAVGLADYKDRAGASCDAIWNLTAESAAQARTSPQLEAFRARDIEVLLMTDPIDAWVVGHLFEFDGVALKPVSEGPPAADGDPEAAGRADDETGNDPRAARVAEALGDRVSEVVLSRRLTDSASCVVDPAGLDPRMRRMLEQAGQALPPMRPKLELNPAHPLVERLGELDADDPRGGQIAALLFDEAVLLEGGELEDPAAFVRRVNMLLQSALSHSAPEGGESTSSGVADAGDTG